MSGYEAFIKIFGELTIAHVAVAVVVIIFLYKCYRKFSDYLIKRHEAQEQKDAQLAEALDGVHKYPEYRKQSLEIQESFRLEFEEIHKTQSDMTARLDRMEEAITRRERNRIRDRLLQAYRYYTNIDNNPSQSWTQMESEAFWEMFSDYEDAGGNGFMHTVVQPAMNQLTVTDNPEFHG